MTPVWLCFVPIPTLKAWHPVQAMQSSKVTFFKGSGLPYQFLAISVVATSQVLVENGSSSDTAIALVTVTF